MKQAQPEFTAADVQDGLGGYYYRHHKEIQLKDRITIVQRIMEYIVQAKDLRLSGGD